MSIGFLMSNQNDAVIWRGPRKNGLIQQFLQEVNWGDLDFLIIDSTFLTTKLPLGRRTSISRSFSFWNVEKETELLWSLLLKKWLWLTSGKNSTFASRPRFPFWELFRIWVASCAPIVSARLNSSLRHLEVRRRCANSSNVGRRLI